ncbi:metallophosphoesterase [Alicyclobacillus dauci]|uniref:Metallophosphoesterase n=1 Tax=Alicyclobacillus dauci TaxID=1475485 RepID=A0ABY6Z1D5_9BACL|nr:metallophosphoesterase [Alicyclobacillus dauci]WAH36041.1 metallophosphoesterase [Alicyclobacillus dauci]
MLWFIVLLVILAVVYLTCIVPTKWLKIERIDMPLGLGLTVLQLSDLHVERCRVRPSKLRSMIRQEKPDIICLTGDFLDKASSFVLLVPYLKMLQGTGISTYAVLGNHDYFLKKPHELRALLQSYGITVLENEAITLDGFHLVGIDDFCSGHHDEEALRRVSRDKPVVVMTHDPTLILDMKESFDYLFAGHLHGKQFAIPFLFKLKDMGPLAAAGIYKGLHRCEKGPFYISKGLGQSGVNLRFLVRSELTIHYL